MCGRIQIERLENKDERAGVQKDLKEENPQRWTSHNNVHIQ